jgi:hypothetical protein
MTNYRINRIDLIQSSSITHSINNGDTSSTGSVGTPIRSAWGVMKDHPTTLGGIFLKGGGCISASHMIQGQIYPCYPDAITVVSGSISVLS